MDSRNEIEAGTVVPPPPGADARTVGEGRPLRRPTDDRVLFGVASGLGRYLGIDPVAVRVAFVLLAVFGGSGLLLYLIGLIAIPEAVEGEPLDAAPRSGGGRSAAIAIGAALIVVGGMNLVGQLVPGLRDLVGPVLVLTAGVLVLVWSGRR
jgi:phage shock protein PspC (stress-responsive transcriptional regulator)